MISNSLEKYLKTMYVLSKQNENIRVTDIAEKMNCSKASVNKAINNLKDEKLVTYETYGKIEITDKGQDMAKKILEAYDIVHLFLKEVLELDDKVSAEDAEKIKSVISDETANKLARYVHKELGLNDLECGYDINEERCRCCLRRKI